jgi:hypothetical protein
MRPWATVERYGEVPRYYFDVHDGDTFIADDEGAELADFESAQTDAARLLGELVLNALPGSQRRVLLVEVRDEHQPVMETRLTFEAVLV